jgi:hypothetical protein
MTDEEWYDDNGCGGCCCGVHGGPDCPWASEDEDNIEEEESWVSLE